MYFLQEIAQKVTRSGKGQVNIFDFSTNSPSQAADSIAGAVHWNYREDEDWCSGIIEHQGIQIFDYIEGSRKVGV